MTINPEQAKFVLRLDRKLHKKIKANAKATNTSMNRFIENALAQVVFNKDPLIGIQGQLESIEKTIARKLVKK